MFAYFVWIFLYILNKIEGLKAKFVRWHLKGHPFLENRFRWMKIETSCRRRLECRTNDNTMKKKTWTHSQTVCRQNLHHKVVTRRDPQQKMGEKRAEKGTINSFNLFLSSYQRVSGWKISHKGYELVRQRWQRWRQYIIIVEEAFFSLSLSLSLSLSHCYWIKVWTNVTFHDSFGLKKEKKSLKFQNSN